MKQLFSICFTFIISLSTIEQSRAENFFQKEIKSLRNNLFKKNSLKNVTRSAAEVCDLEVNFNEESLNKLNPDLVIIRNNLEIQYKAHLQEGEVDEKTKDALTESCKKAVNGHTLTLSSAAAIAEEQSAIWNQVGKATSFTGIPSEIIKNVIGVAVNSGCKPNQPFLLSEFSMEDCNIFKTSLVGTQNQNWDQFTKFVSSYLSAGESMESLLSLSNDPSFCQKCYNELFNFVKKSDKNSFPVKDKKTASKQSTLNHTWVDRDEQFRDLATGRYAARHALYDHLTHGAIKQELLKLTRVMQQYVHAKAISSKGSIEQNSKKFSCNNPVAISQRIISKCRRRDMSSDDPKSRTQEEVASRIRGAFRMLGMTQDQLKESTESNPYSLTSGMNYLYQKVSSIGPEDVMGLSCQSVSREDYVRNQYRSFDQVGLHSIFTGIFVSMIESMDSQELEQLQNGSRPASALLIETLKKSLKQDGDNPVKELFSNKSGELDEDELKIFEFNTGIPMPLKFDGSEADLAAVENALNVIPQIMSTISNHHPNLNLFLNNATVRAKFLSSPEQLSLLFTPQVSNENLEVFAKQCEDAFERISELACAPTLAAGKDDFEFLGRFSPDDIAKAAQEISLDIEDKNPVNQTLAQLSLGRTYCDVNSRAKAETPSRYSDLDATYSPYFDQSDFMRTHKHQHQLKEEDPADAMKKIDYFRLSAKDPAACDDEAVNFQRDMYYCLIHSNQYDCEKTVEVYQDTERVTRASSYRPVYATSNGSNKNKGNQSKLGRLLSSLSGNSQPLSSNTNSGTAMSVARTPAGQTTIPAPATTTQAQTKTQGSDFISSSNQPKMTDSTNISSPQDSSAFNSTPTPTALTSLPSQPSVIDKSRTQSLKRDDNAKKAEYIRQISALRNGAEASLDELDEDELEQIRDGLLARKNGDKNGISRAREKFQKEQEELSLEKAKLQRELDELKNKKLQFANATLTQSTPSASISSGALEAAAIAANGDKQVNTAIRNPSALPSTAVAGQSSDSNFSDSSTTSAGKLGEPSTQNRFFNSKSNSPGFAQDLSIFLDYFETHPTETEAIEFIVKDGQKFIRVPGPQGQKVTISYSEIKDSAIIAKIEKLEQTKKLVTQAKKEKKSISAVLEEEVKRVAELQEKVTVRQAMYDSLIQQLE